MLFGLALLLLSARLLPLVLWLPGLGGLGRALLLVFCELYVMALNIDTLPQLVAGKDVLQLAFPLLHELLAGLLLLLVVATLWAALAAAGRLCGFSGDIPTAPTWTGDGDAGSGAPKVSLAALWTLCGTALFFALDGMSRLLGLVASSYDLLPLPGSDREPTPWHASVEHLSAVGGRLFTLVLLLSLPVLVPRVLAELALVLSARSLSAPPPGNPAAAGWLLSLRPLLWLLSALLGGVAVLSLWLRQGPALWQLFLSP